MPHWLRDISDFTRTLRALQPHLRPGRTLFFVTVGLTVLGFLFDVAAMGLLLSLMGALNPKNAGDAIPSWLRRTWPTASSAQLTLAMCAVVMGCIVTKNGLLYTSAIVAARMKRRAAANLRTGLFERLLHGDISLFERRKSGEVAQVFHQETFRAVMLVDYLLMLVQRACMAIVYLSFIVYLSWALSLATAVLAAAIAAVIGFSSSKIKRLSEVLTKVSLRTAGHLGEMFAGIRVIRATHAEAAEEQHFRQLTGELGRIEEQTTRSQGLMQPLSETGAVLCGMAIIGGAYWFGIRSGWLSALVLYQFCAALLRLLPTLPQIYSVYGQALALAGGLKELSTWLNLPAFPSRPFGSDSFTGVGRRLRFENLTYRYPNGTEALTDFSLEIPAGQTVALVGSSGSGKSTAASLLLRFREPTSGRITVDDRDYWEFSPESWHGRVGVVEQEAFLFHDSIGHNLTFGCPSATPAALDSAIAAAQLSEVLLQQPQGLNTVVGERGASFSGGQRQRMAIARALVRDPKLLILDEATSALDNVSERQVQAALDAARHGRTVLVIAHRLTTIRHADKIAVLDAGRLVEEGTWDELLARGQVFARLVAAAEAAQRVTV